jgi:hypothetical protein
MERQRSVQEEEVDLSVAGATQQEVLVPKNKQEASK